MSLGRRFIGLGSLAPAGTDVDFFVLAGGGSGGGATSTAFSSSAGGGGAGGLRTSYGSTSGRNSSAEAPVSLVSGTTYTITVGAGGGNTTGNGNNGSDSSISGSDITTITSTGGGGGGIRSNAGANGGCGGGGGSQRPSGGSGTANQGFDGGTGSTSARPGSGGGTGSAGGSAGFGSATGGDCLSNSITGTATNYGAGGNSGYPSTSGTDYFTAGSRCGIGGYLPPAHSINADGGDAPVANRGSGGMGASKYSGSGNFNGGSGSSGVVILRMPTADYSGTTTGSPTVSTDGSDTILQFTGSGSYTH